MKVFFVALKNLSRYMYWISGFALVGLMLLTVSDVILRAFSRPIAGVYDLTLLLAGVVIGFAIPFTTWRKAHVRMVFLIDTLSSTWKKILMTLTYVLGIFLFFVVGRGLLLYGVRVYSAGEVSMTVHLPFYPVVFGIGASCLINCIVLLKQLIGLFVVWEEDES
jgi:TRAP-type C4-dicarboxylate transport system permease small subunit